MRSKILFISIALVALVLHFQNCSDVSFSPTNGSIVLSNGNLLQEQSVSIVSLSSVFIQEYKNIITVNFQSTRSDNLPVDAEDLKFYENDIELTEYEILSSESGTSKKLDLVFVIDSTGSMKTTISDVKDSVTALVDQLEADNVNARLCLVTYKDAVEDRCTSFVDDDPTTEINENLESFKTQLAGLTVIGGVAATENILGGVLAAANDVPWANNGQRLMVVIGDQPAFWYSPDNQGEAGSAAPTYQETLDAVLDKEVQVVMVTKEGPGLSEAFTESQPALSVATSGTFYDFNNISTISNLNNLIVDFVSTTITVQYSVSANDLDLTLPVTERVFTATTIAALPVGEVLNNQIQSMLSTIPEGGQVTNLAYDLGHASGVNPDSVQVTINGSSDPVNYSLEGSVLTLIDFPPDSAEVVIRYLPNDLTEALSFNTVALGDGGAVEVLSVKVNDRIVNPNFYSIIYDSDNIAQFSVNPSAFEASDFEGLTVGSIITVLIEFKTLDEEVVFGLGKLKTDMRQQQNTQ